MPVKPANRNFFTNRSCSVRFTCPTRPLARLGLALRILPFNCSQKKHKRHY